MSPASSRATSHRKARAEASAWIVKLHGPHRTRELEAAFRHWLAQSPENACEFEKVTEVWDGARGAAPTPVRARPKPLLTLAKAATLLLLFAGAALLSYRHWTQELYATKVGEQRLVRLEDGSRLTLNSDSVAEVRYSRKQRLVSLTRGEAYFEATHDPERPFVVAAGGHQVTALGTAFVVRFDPDQTAVILVEGKVSVSNEILSPGERLVLTRNAAPRVDSPRIETVTAWRHGEVVLERTTLADAIAEMNRYEDDKLTLDASDIGQLQISGIYHTGDSQAFAQSVARLYHLQVTQSGNQIRLSKQTEVR